ncbi:MAG TPA: LPP20 family lipoprotein [Candidatus Avisuccinivibrio pullicola]|nr:LPP20 family lipoprotein [Candidatus Avisuccinivibrio pullicola]
MKSLVMVMGLMLIAGCGTNFLTSTTISKNLYYTDTGVNEPEDFPVLRATGYAVISRQKGPSETEKEIQALRASKIEAYRELAEQLYGLRIKGSTVLVDTRETRDGVTTEIDAIVQGARVIRQYPLKDTYVTELELDSQIVYNLYQMRGAF